MFTFIYRKPSDQIISSDCIISSNHPNRPTVLFRPIIQIVRLYYFVQSSKSSDCIISSDQIITSDFIRFVLFSSIQLISSDHLISSITSVHLNFVRPYYFRLSYLPVQFSSSYFALFLYLNTNLIQIKSRTRTFPETATRSLRPRRTYCNIKFSTSAAFN